VTSGVPVALTSSDVTVGAHTLQTFSLTFDASTLSVGQHRLQAAIKRLPIGEAPDSITVVPGTVTITTPQPQLVVTPGQAILSVVGGSSTSQTITLGNSGVGSTLSGIQ